MGAFGVSPFAVWRNKPTDPQGSDTRAGVQNYDQLYADTRKWVREGWIDYIAPQIYWTCGFEVADYEKYHPLVGERNRHRQGERPQRRPIIGEATYRACTNTTRDWRKKNVLVKHRKSTRTVPQVGGAIYFSARLHVKEDRRGTTSRLVNRFYSRPAIAPVFGNPTGAPPAPPTNVRHEGQLTWASGDNNAVSYAIYQIPTTAPQACALADATNLAAIVPHRSHHAMARHRARHDRHHGHRPLGRESEPVSG